MPAIRELLSPYSEGIDVVRMYATAMHAGYEIGDVTMGDVRTLAYWWSPEGEERQAASETMAALALSEIVGVFERLPSGPAFRLMVDTLHAYTVPAVGLAPTRPNRAVTLWVQGRWNPGTQVMSVEAVGEAVDVKTLHELNAKYEAVRQGVPYER